MVRPEPHWWRVLAAALLVCLSSARGTGAVEPGSLEGTARGFPALRDLSGKKLADGEFTQWIENGRLHIRIAYDFGGGRRIEERAVLRQRPQLVQEQWSWRELRDGKLYRRFAVDMAAGTATAEKLEDKGMKTWSEEVELDAGRAFAGIGFSLAIKNLRPRLIKGEAIELQAVGFTPKPRAVNVEITHGGLDRMRMSDRTIRGDRFLIHPKLPWLADLFMNVPDTTIWLTNPPPAAFLRVEGPLAEPKDAGVRIDLLPGGASGPAQPIRAAARQKDARDRASR
jgi:hypothetical protein